MDRRSLLTMVAGGFVTLAAGCIEGEAGSGGTTSTADPFPDDVESADRGGGGTTVSTTVDAGSGYSDGSIECAGGAHDAVRAHLEAEIGNLRHIDTGYGRGLAGYDGMAVSVTLTTATYDREGDLIEAADVEFETVVSATPPTAVLKSPDGDRVCAVPVYVSERERHVD